MKNLIKTAQNKCNAVDRASKARTSLLPYVSLVYPHLGLQSRDYLAQSLILQI